MSIESIRLSMSNYQRVVILREKDSERYLAIWIGPAEADAIAVRLQETEVARPLTHDLLRNVIDNLGGNVQHILLNDLANDTFYARIVMDVNGERLEIDSRPSDAIALAVRVQVPIYAEETVLEQAGIVLEDDEGEDGQESPSEGRGPADPAEIERMGAFKDFIEGLDLSDFDERT